MKNTKQRETILGIINSSYDHLNAYEIYDLARNKIPNISLGTVYRNLSALSQDKKIKKIINNEGYDRYDKLDNHNHFVCTKCNKIYDIYDYETKKIKNIDGHKVNDCEIILKGICKECLEKE